MFRGVGERIFGASGALAFLLVASFGSLGAKASIVTLQGSEFDVVYDTSLLGEFNTPVLQGNVLYFTPNDFLAQSDNGQGTVVNSQHATGIQLIANPGYSFGNFYVNAQGDYTMTGASSSVSVAGSLTAVNDANQQVQSVSLLSLNPSLPLTYQDGISHNWAGSSTVASPWLSSAGVVDISLWNALTATTEPGAGAQQALIQEKLAGLQLYIDPVPVPIPAGVPLFLSGLGLVASFSRVRRNVSLLETGKRANR